MAEKMFTLDFRKIDKFNRSLFDPRIKPRSLKGRSFNVMRRVINDQAKFTQITAKKKEIPRAMTVRTGSFNQRSVWAAFARGRELTAITGARTDFAASQTESYLGLGNIELGKSEKNEGVPTTDISRGGSKKRKVFRSKRYKYMKNVIKVSGGSARKTMAILSNRGYKGFIYHRAGLSMPKGIYQFVGSRKKRAGGRMGFDLKMVKMKNK